MSKEKFIYVPDYRENLPCLVAMLEEIKKDDYDVSYGLFTLYKADNIIEKVALTIDQPMPLGKAKCSNWLIKEINEDHIVFENTAKLYVGVGVKLYDDEKG